MNFLLKLTATHAALGRLLDHFRSLLLLATRFYVGWQFWKSGWLKVTSWSTTLDLFRTEYHVPVLPPDRISRGIPWRISSSRVSTAQWKAASEMRLRSALPADGSACGPAWEPLTE